jgi:hypothetical protein
MLVEQSQDRLEPDSPNIDHCPTCLLSLPEYLPVNQTQDYDALEIKEAGVVGSGRFSGQ